jgi:hypothetical protein
MNAVAQNMRRSSPNEAEVIVVTANAVRSLMSTLQGAEDVPQARPATKRQREVM